MRGPRGGPRRFIMNLVVFLITKRIAGQAFTTLPPTFPPAPFNAVFCHGGACQYRVPAVVPPLPTIPPRNPLFDLLRNREFCRGKACIGAPVGLMGWPVSPEADAFALNCSHLFNDVAGGLKGEDGKRTLMDVHDSFVAWCKKRVDPIKEKGACPAYADVMIMALSPNVNAPSQGDVGNICTFLMWFIGSVRAAEVDLKLIPEAIPSSKSLLAIAFNRLGGKGGGAESPRGRKWKKWLHEHKFNTQTFVQMKRYYQPFTCLSAGTNIISPFMTNPILRQAIRRQSLLQEKTMIQEKVSSMVMSDVTQPLCFTEASSGKKYYQLVPGSPDGIAPPVNIDAKLLEYCMAQFHEIQAGLPQTGGTIATLTKDWCGWQSTLALFTGDEESARADWTFRTCNNMYIFMGYALRNNLDKGLWPSQVCKLLHLEKGPVFRVAELVRDAWVVAPLCTSCWPLGNSVDHEATKAAMENAQKIADEAYAKIRKQRDYYSMMLKGQAEAILNDTVVDKDPIPPPPPPLPAPAASQSLFLAPEPPPIKP